MKTRKRILSFLLAVCLTLTTAIPAAFATGSNEVLTYSFVFSESATASDGKTLLSSGSDIKSSNANPYKGDPETCSGYAFVNGDCYYLNSSSNRGFKSDTSAIRTKFNATTATNGDWIAIKICKNSKDGNEKIKIGSTYALTLTIGASNSGGLFKVYVVDSTTYTDLIKTGNYNLGSATADTNTKFFDDIDSAVLNNVITIDNYGDSESFAATPSLGNVTFAEDDDYVLIFQCVGKNESSSGYQAVLTGLTMTPVYEAAIGNEKYDTLENAFSAAEKASSSTTVQLLDGVPEKNKVEIPAGVTLDLNGNDLTASEVSCAANAKIIDKVGGGLLVADTITTQPGNGGYLPLKDTAAGGYRLYEAKIEALGINSKSADGDSAKFWFNLYFTKSEAYTLIEKGDTGFGFAANMKWNETNNITAANADATFIGTWAEAVAQDAGKDVGLKVTGLKDVTGFTLTPVVSANDVTVSASALSLS